MPSSPDGGGALLVRLVANTVPAGALARSQRAASSSQAVTAPGRSTGPASPAVRASWTPPARHKASAMQRAVQSPAAPHIHPAAENRLGRRRLGSCSTASSAMQSMANSAK